MAAEGIKNKTVGRVNKPNGAKDKAKVRSNFFSVRVVDGRR
jgi:hypothetical protein